IWFLKGDVDVSFLKENKVPFWEKWTSNETNTIGPMYPMLWRKKPEVKLYLDYAGSSQDPMASVIHVDQINNLLEGLKKDIETRTISRRHYLSNIALGLRPDESLTPIENVNLGNMALDTCHQVFYVSLRPLTEEQKKQSVQYQKDQFNAFETYYDIEPYEFGIESMLVMRSNDVMVGKPHNVAQYALLNIMIANALKVMPLSHRHTVHDSHVYLSHVDQAKEMLESEPYPLPKLYVRPDLTAEKIVTGEITVDDFKLLDYQSHEPISFSLE
ncbi:thymidylate synthase, partial [Neisseria sp. P0024.S002]|uniref:thymidylate synthase n=1 Tax=Neisseria sp. P0024.S002 TaxID=3436846 RepID=UPI003F7DBC85